MAGRDTPPSPATGGLVLAYPPENFTEDFLTRVCVKCGVGKAESEYYAESGGGLKRSCKSCVIAYNKARYHANSDEWKARHKDWCSRNKERLRELWRGYGKNPERRRLHELKKRARGNARSSYLGLLYGRQRGMCAICGCGLSAYEVDHILPIKLGGKTDKGNLQLLCRPCNQAKRARHPIEYMQSRGFLL